MPPQRARIFVDTNAIRAAHQCRCWNAIRQYFTVVTVQICIEEAVRPNRDGDRLVARTEEELEGEVIVSEVTDEHRAKLLSVLQGRVDLDDGELDLLAAAYTEPTGTWWLCGPDKATVRAMHVLGLLDQLSSLEELASAAGVQGYNYRTEYSQRWLSNKKTMLLMGNNII